MIFLMIVHDWLEISYLNTGKPACLSVYEQYVDQRVYNQFSGEASL